MPSLFRPMLVAALALAACGDPALSATSAELILDPLALDFGRAFVGHPLSRELTLRNASRAPVRVEFEAAAPFGLEATEWDLAPASSIRLGVGFAPAQAGTFEALLVARFDGREVQVGLRGVAEVPPACPSPAACHAVAFDPEAGACVDSFLGDGTPCALSDACLTGTVCLAGTCVGTPVVCDDQDLCTRDSCDPAAGCVHEDVSARCPVPTQTCKVARCEPASGCGVADAEDGTPCGPADCKTADVCLLGGCRTVPVPEGTTCFPATPCQGRGVCRDEVCERPEPGPMEPAWSYPPQGGTTLRFSGTVDDRGHLYVLELSKSGGAFTSLTSEGFVRFREELLGNWSSYSATLSLDAGAGAAYVSDGRSRLSRHRTADGESVWAIDLATLLTPEDRAGYVASYGGLLAAPQAGGLVLASFLVGESNHLAFLVALDAATGAVRWKFSRPGHFYGLVTDGQGTTYLSSYGCWASTGEVHAIGPDGALRWSTSEGGHPFAFAGDGRVLVWRDGGLAEVSPGSPADPLLIPTSVSAWDDLLSDEDNLYFWSREWVGSSQALRYRSATAPTGVERWAVPVQGTTLSGTSLLTTRSSALVVTYAQQAGAPGVDYTLRELGHGKELFACTLPGPLTGATALTANRWIAVLGGALQAFPAPYLELAPRGWVAWRGGPSRGLQPR